jgi:Tfp pilus assembly protein PilX
MRNPTRTLAVAAAVLATAAAVLAGCGTSGTAPSGSGAGSSTVTTSAPENNPAGDIPDNQAYVPFTPPGGLVAVSVPEGWARTTDGAATVFTDKSNTVRIETHTRVTAPNTESVTVEELPAIASSTAGYRPVAVSAVQRKSGQVMLITYQGTSPPNPVTGKIGTDAVERYEFWRDGHEVILTLSGPVGADNVDPWRTITDSLQWQ